MVFMLVAVIAATACSSGSSRPDAASADITDTAAADQGSDTASTDVLADVAQADLPADSPSVEVAPDLPPTEVDETPGCVGDFCAAGPQHAPDPAEWGPFPVGVRTEWIDLYDHQGNPRTIRIEIWYPTTEAYRDGPFDAIDFSTDAPPEAADMVVKYKDQLPPIEVKVTRDTPVRTSDGPYPLVVFSHGAYGIRFQSVFYTIPLASHGYVVASMDHTGNTIYDLLAEDGYNIDDMILSALDRPYDTVMTIAHMTWRVTVKGDPFFGVIDTTRIGLSGHSFGGFTSVLVPFIDPRIKAVVAHSPATSMLGALGYDIKKFPVPILIQGGKLDKTLKPDTEIYPAYEKLPSPKHMFMLETGGHFTFSDICLLDLVYIANSMGIEDADNALGDGCADYNLDPDIAHPIINQFAIGFFNYHLRDSKGSLDFFDAAAAGTFGDLLTYQSEM
jgi:predicted dienelactone hydrolase